jgi:hypothetical protein
MFAIMGIWEEDLRSEYPHQHLMFDVTPSSVRRLHPGEEMDALAFKYNGVPESEQ